jgi:hypothetical protein
MCAKRVVEKAASKKTVANWHTAHLVGAFSGEVTVLAALEAAGAAAVASERLPAARTSAASAASTIVA